MWWCPIREDSSEFLVTALRSTRLGRDRDAGSGVYLTRMDPRRGEL
jgi:hypothetical protein